MQTQLPQFFNQGERRRVYVGFAELHKAVLDVSEEDVKRIVKSLLEARSGRARRARRRI